MFFVKTPLLKNSTLNISKESKVGVIGAMILLSILFTFNYLNRKNVFSRNLIITATFDDIEFLKKGNPVLIKGRDYGRVTAIYKQDGKLLVDMNIEPYTKIPSDAKAVISEMSILGGRTISIVYTGACSGNCLVSGSKIPGEVVNMATQVATTVGPILKSFGTLADTLMSSNGMENMIRKAHASVASLATTTKVLERKMKGMNRTLPGTIKGFRDLTTGLLGSDVQKLKEAMSGDSEMREMALALDSLVNNLSSLKQEDIETMTKIFYTLKDQAETLPEKIQKGNLMIVNADKALDNLNAKIAPFQAGTSGTIPKLLYNADYKDSLSNTIQNASQKIRDIREHPEENLSLKKKK